MSGYRIWQVIDAVGKSMGAMQQRRTLLTLTTTAAKLIKGTPLSSAIVTEINKSELRPRAEEPM